MSWQDIMNRVLPPVQVGSSRNFSPHISGRYDEKRRTEDGKQKTHQGVDFNYDVGSNGFAVEPPVKNQGRGAAMMRIEALRRLGPQLWFNEATTEPGRDALGFYHERKDETRGVGLGPEHDWSSHAADALGLMAICYEQPGRAAAFNRPIRYAEQGWV